MRVFGKSGSLTAENCLGKWLLQTAPDKRFWNAKINLRGINY